MKNERIVFFGTPEFAAYQLEYMIKEGVPVVGVVTTPDRPQGRGRKLQACEVKLVAQKHGIPTLEPNNLKNPDFQDVLRSWNATLQIVVAFRMLPEAVWNMPLRGTVNLHASLLPQYRGAAPINHAIINGETKTGVSTFLLQHKIDTGNILLSKPCEILEDETAGSLHDKLMRLGAPVIVETIKGLCEGELEGRPQDQLTGGTLKDAPKIFKEDCHLNLDENAELVYNKIRGLSPYPGAFIKVAYRDNDHLLKIYRAKPVESGRQITQKGLFVEDKKLYLACKNGYLQLLELQISGKQRMDFSAFCNGFEIESMKITS